MKFLWLLIAFLILASQVYAFNTSSTAYTSNLIISGGGTNISSTTYQASTAISQPVVGNVSSTNYEACFGFFCIFSTTTTTTTTTLPATPGQGGAGGGAPSPGGGLPSAPAKIISFAVTPQSAETTLLEGETDKIQLAVSNIGNVEITLAIILERLEGVVFLGAYQLTIPVGQTQFLELNILAKEQGLYYGGLIIRTNEIQKSVPILVKVKSKTALFDIDIDIPENSKKLKPNDELTAQVTLLNLGEADEQVTVGYAIKDFWNNIILSEEELLSLKDQKSFTKRFKLPKALTSGNYVLTASVVSKDGIGTAGDLFDILETKVVRNYRIYALILIALFSGLLILLLLTRFMKKMKKKKATAHQFRAVELEDKLATLEEAYKQKYISEESYNLTKYKLEEAIKRLKGR